MQQQQHQGGGGGGGGGQQHPRRSMGTVPHRGHQGVVRVGGRTSSSTQDSPPGRSRSSASNAAGSSVKRSGTRIPRFGAAPPSFSGTKAGGGHVGLGLPKRSSSSHVPRQSQGGPVRSASKQQQQQLHLAGSSSSSAGRSRSHSATRTPQRVLQPQSLNINNPANRYSMSSGRGSFVGSKIVKDSRGLNDKPWQQRTVHEIIVFLHENGYKLLSQSDFPLNSTEFKNVFEHVLNFIIPGYEVPKTRIETELPQLIKRIGYPFQVSKSCFQTLGTPHSWPAILGVLHYVVNCAASSLEYNVNIVKSAFPCTDDMGFDTGAPSDDFSVFGHLVRTYDAFNKGRDEFQQELEELEAELETNHGINVESLAQQERKRRDCQKMLGELQRVPNKCEETERRKRDAERDLEALKKYTAEKLAYKKRKEKEAEETKRRLEELGRRKEALQASIEALKAQCQERGITGIDGLKVEHKAQSLRQQIEQIKDHIQEIDKRRWGKEMALGKAMQALDEQVRRYNTDLVSLELDPEAEVGLRMDLGRSPQEMFGHLQALTMKYRDVERELDQSLLQLESDAGKMGGMLRNKTRELEALEEEHQTLSREVTRLEAEVEEKDAKVTEELAQVKSQVMEAKQRGSSDLRELKCEAERLEQEVEAQRKKVDAAFEEGCRRQEEAMDKAERFLRSKVEERDRLFHSYKDRSQVEIDESKKLIREMEDLVKRL